MSTNSLQIATWNVLADCYATPIGPSGQSMNWKKRKLNIQHILKLLATPSPSSSTSSSSSTPTAPPSSHDILLLQEIDHINDFYRPLLQSFGYECHYIQRPTKHDGCLIAFSRSKFQLVASEEVNFDDLTEKFHEMDIARQSFRRHNVALILCLKDCRTHSPSETPPATDTSTTTPIPSPIPTSECDRYLIISTAHIYWNPAYPEVKTGQSKYLLDRIAFFQTKLNLRCNTCSNQRNSTTTTATAATICHYCPIIVGGDFNSTPDSEQYALLTSYQPYVAKYLSSCCYCGLNTFSMNSSSTTKPDPSHYFQGCYYGGNQTKFLCDPTLSKLCRWLRVLGLNAAMHQTLPPPSAATAATTSSSSKLSKKKQKKAANGPPDFEEIFRRAKSEYRVILTTSKSLRLRAACPEAVLVNQTNLEQSLVEILERYNIELDREKFLTVCGKCGGNIITCEGEIYKEIVRKKKIIIENRGGGGGGGGELKNPKTQEASFEDSRNDENLTELEVKKDENEEITICGAVCKVKKGCEGNKEGIPWVPTDREIFMCESCCQPYWWNEQEKSSPARAMVLAHHLYDVITQHRAAKSPLVPRRAENDSHGVVQISGDTSTSQGSVDVDTLRSMFQARDLALNKLITATNSLTITSTSTSETPTSMESTLSSPRVNEYEVETMQCVSCQEYITCTFPPLKSAVASYRIQHSEDEIPTVTVSDLEPKYTNWTTDYLGTLDYIFISSECVVDAAHIYPRHSDDDSDEKTPLRIPSSHGPYPNTLWPSDHMLIDITLHYP